MLGLNATTSASVVVFSETGTASADCFSPFPIASLILSLVMIDEESMYPLRSLLRLLIHLFTACLSMHLSGDPQDKFRPFCFLVELLDASIS